MPETKTEKEFKFTLTESESNLVIQAVGELPFKVVGGLIAKMQAQAAPQIEAQLAKAKAESAGTPKENKDSTQPEPDSEIE